MCREEGFPKLRLEMWIYLTLPRYLKVLYGTGPQRYSSPTLAFLRLEG